MGEKGDGRRARASKQESTCFFCVRREGRKLLAVAKAAAAGGGGSDGRGLEGLRGKEQRGSTKDFNFGGVLVFVKPGR